MAGKTDGTASFHVVILPDVFFWWPMKRLLFIITILVAGCALDSRTMIHERAGPQYRDAEDFFRSVMTDDLRKENNLANASAKTWDDFLDCAWVALSDHITAGDMVEFDKMATGRPIPKAAGLRIKQAFIDVFQPKPGAGEYGSLEPYCPDKIRTFKAAWH